MVRSQRRRPDRLTVDELHDVLQREFNGVNRRLDAINGKVAEHEKDLTTLKVRVAYWAGGAVVAATFIGWVIR